MLIGEKIILRPIQYQDWEETINWRNDLFIKASTLSHPFPITFEMEKKWYEDNLNNKGNCYLPFTLIDKESGKILGYFSLNNINWISRTAFVSGAVGEKDKLGKGYGKEAVKLLLNYAFEFLNLQKVCAYVNSDHPALKTWEKLGAVIEGKLIKHYYGNGKYHEVLFISWFSNIKNIV